MGRKESNQTNMSLKLSIVVFYREIREKGTHWNSRRILIESDDGQGNRAWDFIWFAAKESDQTISARYTYNHATTKLAKR